MEPASSSRLTGRKKRRRKTEREARKGAKTSLSREELLARYGDASNNLLGPEEAGDFVHASSKADYAVSARGSLEVDEYREGTRDVKEYGDGAELDDDDRPVVLETVSDAMVDTVASSRWKAHSHISHPPAEADQNVTANPASALDSLLVGSWQKSSPKRERLDSDKSADSDLSLPRRRRINSDASSFEKEGKTSVDPHGSDSDLSLPRRKRVDSDDTSSERGRKDSMDSRASDSDLSLPRRKRADSEESRHSDSEHRYSKDAKTLHGPVRSVVGRSENQDHAGEKSSTQEFDKLFAKGKTKKEIEANLDREWRMGTADLQKAQFARKELHEAQSRRFAVLADDKEFNDDLKQKVRPEDPMAAHLAKRKNIAKTDSGVAEGSSHPVYSGPPGPPNRFGIKPGYRWDGIDRGNGFENRLLSYLSSHKVHAEQKYKYLSSDM